MYPFLNGLLEMETVWNEKKDDANVRFSQNINMTQNFLNNFAL